MICEKQPNVLCSFMLVFYIYLFRLCGNAGFWILKFLDGNFLNIKYSKYNAFFKSGLFMCFTILKKSVFQGHFMSSVYILT